MKYTNPTRFSFKPYGSLWKTDIDTYIQTSKDESNPEWKSLSDIIKVVYSDNFDQLSFIEAILNTYKEKKETGDKTPVSNKTTKDK